MNRRRQRGQVLVLFVGAVIGFCALCALAIDVANVYSLQQTEKTAADAASLAGAQDLQIRGSRALDTNQQVSAVQDALANLVSRFGATGTATTTASGSTCTPVAGATINDMVYVSDCALVGTPYWVTIKTPSPSAVDVEPTRAVEVTVKQPDVSLTFARLFGQHDWAVSKTSVAGLAFGGSYAVITLRPPTSGRSGNNGDITINGTGGFVNAVNGDIGMNTGDVLNGNHATVDVSDGYYVRYYGDANQQNTPPGPNAYKQLPALIPDPGYWVPPVPSSSVLAPYATLAAAQDTSSACTAAEADAVASGYPAATICYLPGVYNVTMSVPNGTNVLLEPGVYWFTQGVTLKGGMIGGWDANSPGVALVVPETSSNKLAFNLNGAGAGSANFLALNRGTQFAGGGTCATSPTNCATAAVDVWAGNRLVQTNTTPPLIMSVIVSPDPSNPCPVTVPAPNCSDGTLNWTGQGGTGTLLSVAGVVYAPSDNITVAGNGDPRGYLGQLVGWTITYSGNSTLNQYYPGSVPNGSLRLDEACSGGTSPCSP